VSEVRAAPSPAPEIVMPRAKSPRKQQRNRRSPSPRDARVMEEIKNQRYLAFVRAIVGARGPASLA
jgi:hypothetical protein